MYSAHGADIFGTFRKLCMVHMWQIYLAHFLFCVWFTCGRYMWHISEVVYDAHVADIIGTFLKLCMVHMWQINVAHF